MTRRREIVGDLQLWAWGGWSTTHREVRVATRNSKVEI
jgi:hypothetical protein